MFPASLPDDPLLITTLSPAWSALWTLFHERLALFPVAVKVVIPETVEELTLKVEFIERAMFQANKMRFSSDSIAQHAAR
jgi:hypothetical protein